MLYLILTSIAGMAAYYYYNLGKLPSPRADIEITPLLPKTDKKSKPAAKLVTTKQDIAKSSTDRTPVEQKLELPKKLKVKVVNTIIDVSINKDEMEKEDGEWHTVKRKPNTATADLEIPRLVEIAQPKVYSNDVTPASIKADIREHREAGSVPIEDEGWHTTVSKKQAAQNRAAKPTAKLMSRMTGDLTKKQRENQHKTDLKKVVQQAEQQAQTDRLELHRRSRK